MLNATANKLIVGTSVDYQRFYSKPVKKSIAIITNRIADWGNTYKLENLANLAGDTGRSWCPAIFIDGKRKIANVKSQQIFALDFDNGITWEEVKTRADKYRLPISFAYETFSSIDKNKFRVALCNDVEITDSRVAKIIQIALMEIFPECDPACKDCSRLFLGGKGNFYVNDNINTDVFNIGDLMVSLVEYYKDIDKINYLRLIKKYSEQVGIDLKNGYPRIEIIDEETRDDIKIEISGVSPINTILIESNPQISKNDKSYYAIYLSDKVKKVSKDGTIIFSPTNTKFGKRDLIQKFKFDDLMDCCRLYSAFAHGERWCYHTELWGMATNLCQIKSGGDTFIKIIQNEKNKQYPSYHDKDWGYYINYIQKMDYLPQKCINFCPYVDDCDHAANMIWTARTKRNTIVELASNSKYVSLNEAEGDLADKFSNVQNSEGNDIHVIVAQTGIGKSKTYIDMLEQADKPYIVAVPTHKLKEEIYDKCATKGYDVIKTPVLPPELPRDVLEEIERLYELGASYTAGKYIRTIAELKKLPELIQYIDELEKVKNFSGHIITTHDRLLYFKDEQFSNHNIIIDEDIIKKLLKISKVSVKDLLKIQQIKYINTLDKNKVDQKFRSILINTDYQTFAKVESIYLEDMDNFEAQVAEQQSKINSNVIGFLKSCVAYRYNSDRDKMTVKGFYSDTDIIQYVVKHNLPNQKIIIMSATADKQVYDKMFGQRAKFHYCKEARYEGKLIQYPQKSFSRDCIKNNEELMDKARDIIGEIPVITFKALKDNKSDLNFGGLEGHNIYEGKNLAVVGTPHLNELVYKMYAVALDIDISDSKMRYQEIKWNHFKFWFMTYDNKDLRNIQLWLIESELEQAIGRARLLRNNCSAFLFSNFPLKQAEYKYIR